jgi:hypothetical protein
MNETDVRYSIKLSFEAIQLPPFRDILVLGRNAEHGTTGLTKILEMLAPGRFDTIDIHDRNVEAIFVSKQLLRKIPAERVVQALEKKVFPFVAEGELVRVDFKVDVTFNTIEYEA